MTQTATGRMSRRKGVRAELDVARILGAWWGCEFHRTPASGGSKLKVDWSLAGDLVTTDQTWPFHVEVKRREGWRLEQLFAGPCAWLTTWWAQTVRECPAGRTPLLVFGRARAPWLVAMRPSDDAYPSTCRAALVLVEPHVVVQSLADLASQDPDEWRVEPSVESSAEIPPRGGKPMTGAPGAGPVRQESP